MGRAPVLSPTCTISSAIPGKNPLRRKPELSECPAVTSFCASRIDWESSGLVTESLVVSSAGMIGRPPCSSVESVRANSATENLSSNLPATGERNFSRSHHICVAGDRNAERTPKTTSPIPTRMGASRRLTPVEKEITNWVSGGNVTPRSEYSRANFGTMKVTTKVINPKRNTVRNVG